MEDSSILYYVQVSTTQQERAETPGVNKWQFSPRLKIAKDIEEFWANWLQWYHKKVEIVVNWRIKPLLVRIMELLLSCNMAKKLSSLWTQCVITSIFKAKFPLQHFIFLSINRMNYTYIRINVCILVDTNANYSLSYNYLIAW